MVAWVTRICCRMVSLLNLLQVLFYRYYCEMLTLLLLFRQEKTHTEDKAGFLVYYYHTKVLPQSLLLRLVNHYPLHTISIHISFKGKVVLRYYNIEGKSAK